MSDNSNQPVLEHRFSQAEIQHILDMLNSAGLLGPDGVTIKSMIAGSYKTNPPQGVFAPIYAYIYSVINYPNTPVDPSTVFWFSQAGNINSDLSKQSAADNYIRGVTQYGLMYNGLLSGLTQAQINTGLQVTSNFIAQNVIQEIIDDGGIPSFNDMIQNDISAAIGEPSLSPFVQDVGGWGGSFYFWGASL